MKLKLKQMGLKIAILMLIAGILPWLNDPLGTAYNAWLLPLDSGWQFHIVFCSYGALCLCCSLYALLLALAGRGILRELGCGVRQYQVLGWFCVIPTALFFWQYLCVDMPMMELLSLHKMEALLVQAHFGYQAAPQLVPLDPLALSDATLGDRFRLLIDQLAPGPFLPCLCACTAIKFSRSKLFPRPSPLGGRARLCVAAGLLLLIVGLGRAPAALLCEYEARVLLSSGNYPAALQWLDATVFLNPELAETASYHIERGEALYFLAPSQLGPDSRLYLAAVYRAQKDDLDAYLQLLAIEHAPAEASWSREEMSVTLARLAEEAKPLRSPPDRRLSNDAAAQPWLQDLLAVDPSNIYGHYMIGRIAYDMHNEAACVQHMTLVVRLSSDADISSSAYAYMALSEVEQGNDGEARLLLFKAVALDANYRNNTAREALSGLQ
jgi:hypothetical protein